MKYTPKEIQGNVNISETHPLKELFLLLGGLLGLLLVAYLVLGFAVDFVVPRLPSGIERYMGGLYADAFERYPDTEAEESLQALVDELVTASSDLEQGIYRVHLISSNQANALALPGGHIVILSSLIDQLESENELAFILAHELGHFSNRDHLKGLGRGLVLTALSSFLFNLDSSLTNFLMKSLMTVDMKFSQRQETRADLYGIELVNALYGHVSGATDFFEKISKEDTRGQLAYFFATHPYPPDRIERLQQEIARKEYAAGEKTDLDASLQEMPEETDTHQPSLKDILKRSEFSR